MGHRFLGFGLIFEISFLFGLLVVFVFVIVLLLGLLGLGFEHVLPANPSIPAVVALEFESGDLPSLLLLVSHLVGDV